MRPYLRVANVFEDRIDVSDVMSMNFTPKEFLTYRLLPGDILLNEGQTPDLLGRPAMYQGIPAATAFTNSLIRFQAGPAVLPQWALLVFRHHMHSGRFKRECRVTTNMAHLSAARFQSVEFPVPPLAEQRRIVDRVEELLPLAEQSSRDVKQLLARLERIRSTVVEAVLAPHRSTIALKDALEEPLANGRSVPTQANGFPVLRLTAVRDGRIDLREQKAGAWTADEARPWTVQPGDFLIVRGNGSLRLVGRGGLVGQHAGDVAYPDTLIRARVDATVCRPEYLRIAWHSKAVRAQLEAAARTTAGIYKVNQGHLLAVTLPLPPAEVQDEVVRRVSALETALGPIQADAQRLPMKVRALRRSLLAAAVAGDLVARNAHDEPAEALLRRIGEPAVSKPPARGRRPGNVARAGAASAATDEEESA